ncbi:MAG: 3-dehydroquinate synthase [Clostridia bacterium]|nr:3-dehydroquinate synthase [Clostridia bacterium]
MDKLQEARRAISAIDAEMAELFVRRMEAVGQVAQYKQEHGLPIFDGAREREVLEKGARRVTDPALREHYARFLQNNMDVSKDYQRRLLAHDAPLRMELGSRSYDIVIRRGCLKEAGSLLDLDRKVCIVTDRGVPEGYVRTLAAQCKAPVVVTVDGGEANKTMDTVAAVCRAMLEAGFTRRDCVVAVGGGLVGDLAGFAAASFLRGVDFYNIPTTLLAQVDSSIGGKTGVNLAGVKNMVGAFWQPRKVLIDPDTLDTLSPRLYAEGMAEAVKMALTSDAAFFTALEQGGLPVEQVLEGALRIKKTVVEQDERETGLRKLLNFGHTIGHGVEAAAGGALYHGECVALGMVPMCAPAVRARLLPLLEKLGLPTRWEGDKAAAWQAMSHDKKSTASGFSAVFVDRPGEGCVKQVTFEEMKAILEGAWQA